MTINCLCRQETSTAFFAAFSHSSSSLVCWQVTSSNGNDQCFISQYSLTSLSHHIVRSIFLARGEVGEITGDHSVGVPVLTAHHVMHTAIAHVLYLESGVSTQLILNSASWFIPVSHFRALSPTWM